MLFSDVSTRVGSFVYLNPAVWEVKAETEADMMEKLPFRGAVISIQPRIRIHRSFDEMGHQYLGYALHLQGWVGDTEEERFSIGIGKAAQGKHQFKIRDVISGQCLPVTEEKRMLEPVEYYKVSKLKVVERSSGSGKNPPPWDNEPPPDLETYRWRGHRRLAAKTYEAKCFTCIWGCRVPVEITIDHWKPDKKKYRFETFCYGPLSCSLYKPGPQRKVPGRKGMIYVEEDWVDLRRIFL